MPIVVNFAPLKQAMAATTARVDAATAVAATQGAHVYERFIKLELSKGSHAKGTPTGSANGEPPWAITGTLRRSVQVAPPIRLGTARYEAQAGPTVIYGRAQELGHPRWPAGVRHPFVQPGADKAEASGQVEAAVIRVWRAALGG